MQDGGGGRGDGLGRAAPGGAGGGGAGGRSDLPGQGRKIEVNEIHIYRLEGGKAVEHRAGRDDLAALRQLGVIADAVPEPGARREPAGEEVGA
jgi:hypothetical protein